VSAPEGESGITGPLESVLSGELGKAVKIRGLKRMPGGASRETWVFEASTDDGERRLVLRRDPPGAMSGGLRLEAKLLEAARLQDVPVPWIVASGDAGGELASAFIVVEYVEGETIPRRILRDESLAEARSVLARRCGQILAAVHRIPPESVPGLAGGHPLEQLRALADQLGQPHPAFELAFRWLSEHRPARSGECVVHGDFRNGNLIVGPDGVRAVLDWELSHLGDPIEDLGWLCVKAWRFGSPMVVGGFGPVEELVSGYSEAGGGRVDLDVLRWWEVLGTLRWGLICIVQTLTHTSGAVRSVELAAIGRRVCEVEWDLLEMLG
jgi:aminoglycoside phosphotransferase (APT) family kinase protein